MLRLTYSNRAEKNLALMSEEIRRLQRIDPLAPIQIVVPHRQVELWIRQALAQSFGIAAGLEVVQLKRFVMRLCDAREGDEPLRLIDSEVLLDQLLALFFEEGTLSSDATLSPLARYLGDARSVNAITRRFQLAGNLARLFDEYALSRDFLERWQRGDSVGFSQNTSREVEIWQAALWRLLRARLDEFGRSQSCRYALIGELPGLEGIALSKPTFLFGVSHMALAYHRLVDWLGRRSSCDLHVYALNPCAELWEHLRTARELRRVERRSGRSGEGDPFDLTGERGHPLLHAWGRAGRENIRVLNEVTDCDFEDAFGPEPDVAPLSTLQRLQADLRANRADIEPIEQAGETGDRSIEILSCASVQRECEVVAAEVAALFAADPSLRLGDIALLVASPSPDSHFSHLTSALASFGIPTCLSELPFEQSSRLCEAARLLIELPLTRLTRSDVLAVLDHPALRGHLKGLSRGELPGLIDRLGIHYGLDRADQGESYLASPTPGEGRIGRDLFNWDQGLKRLALGEVMWTRAEGDESACEIRTEEEAWTRRYWPEPAPMAFDGQLGNWTLLVRSLLEDVRNAASRDRVDCPEKWLTLAEWARFLDALLSTYLFADGEFEARERDLLCRTARAISLHRLMGRTANGSRERPLRVPYRIAVELLLRGLSGLRGRRGHFLVDGVAIGRFQPQRALPFRHIFVLGLDAAFPAQPPTDPLDLRRAPIDSRDLRRLIRFDVSERERGQYLALETILAARERLVFSFVGRDPETGERLEPSSVIADLERVLALYAPDQNFRRELPVRRCDLALFPSLAALLAPATEAVPKAENAPVPSDPPALPEARREAISLALRTLLTRVDPEAMRALESRHEPLTRDAFARLTSSLAADEREAAVAIAESLDLFPASGRQSAECSEARAVTISLSDLRRFLENPAQASAKVSLCLDDDREDETDDALTSLDDERFSFDEYRVDRAVFLRGGIEAFIEGAGELWRGAGAAIRPHVDERRALPKGSRKAADKARKAAVDEAIKSATAGFEPDLRAWFERHLPNELDTLRGAGKFPAGLFGRASTERLIDLLTAWSVGFLQLPLGAGESLRRMSFGEPRAGQKKRDFRPAIDLGEFALSSGEMVHVHLVGTTEIVGVQEGCLRRAISFVARRTEEKTDCLRSLLSALACLAARVAPEVAEDLDCVTIYGSGEHRIDSLSGVSPSEALDYLRGLARALLDGEHLYWLPGEAVLKAMSKGARNALDKNLGGVRQSRGPLRQSEIDALPLPGVSIIESAFFPRRDGSPPRWRFILDHLSGVEFSESRLGEALFDREEPDHG